MIKQTVKGMFLFITAIAILMAASNYFSNQEIYHQLIITAFIIHYAGYVIDYIMGWHIDRRKIHKPVNERESWMLRRQAD